MKNISAILLGMAIGFTWLGFAIQFAEHWIERLSFKPNVLITIAMYLTSWIITPMVIFVRLGTALANKL